jgi:hypothetical protein
MNPGAGIILPVLGPFVVAVAITLGFAAVEMSGRAPLSDQRPANVAEAAGMGLDAETLRLLRRGNDPRRLYPVRPDIISSSVTRANAFEAAVWSRRVKVMRLLDNEGRLSRQEKQRLACLATGLGVKSVVDYLAPDGVIGCDPEAVFAAIEARSR